MAAWLAIAGTGAKALGAQTAQKTTLAGAKAQAGIEKLSREAQARKFKADVEYQKPYFEAGEKAIDPYSEAISGELDPTQSPMYKMQVSMLSDQLEGASEDMKADTLASLGISTTEELKSGFLDMQKIGLGSAASAGTSALNFGQAYASSVSRGGAALAQGTLSGSMQQQNAWTGAMESLSGLPAYSAQQSYLNKPAGPQGLGGIDYAVR